jgi:hypothetical protein
MTATSALTQFAWRPQPEAAWLVSRFLDEARDDCAWLKTFDSRLASETGTRLLDWVDHFILLERPGLMSQLQAVGYRAGAAGCWRADEGQFPAVRTVPSGRRAVVLKVESVVDFLVAQGLMGTASIAGPPTASIRSALVASGNAYDVIVAERHGNPGLHLDSSSAADPLRLLEHREKFRLRQRRFTDVADGFEHARRLVETAARDLGMPRACDLFFAAERGYWQSRNMAARIQKMRQDSLGLGWANHDHHTYRSSREHFSRLIAIFELMGFRCRERFYAGKDAGWGAQVLEEPLSGIVIFADVDLSPDEVTQDFSHEPLAPRDSLGTVGLWCRLHGEAFLEAGMHHLECQFLFEAARDELKAVGIETMKPFTDLPYLRQAFTKGEVWPVEPSRIEALLADGLITSDQADTFRTKGAVGSHLELLQRNDGYKGFNQTGISEIIRDTDPRRLVSR